LNTERILRYHAVGNAVTPQVVEWVARRLAAVLRKADREAMRDYRKAACA
jgi:DNA (cytosine-5)-methyltransferase 1